MSTAEPERLRRQTSELKKGIGATVAKGGTLQIKLRSTRPAPQMFGARLAVHSNSVLVISPQSLLSSRHDDPIRPYLSWALTVSGKYVATLLPGYVSCRYQRPVIDRTPRKIGRIPCCGQRNGVES